MEKIIINSPTKAYRLLNPGAVVLITVGDGRTDNIFAVTWNMPVRKDPGMVAILSGKQHYSYPFIAKTGEFGINVPDISIVDAVYGCGTTSGFKEKDKFSRFGLTRHKAEKIKVPLIDEAVAHLECRVCQLVDLGASSLIIAQILTAAAEPRYFIEGQWMYENGLQLIHHLDHDRFAVSNRVITAKKI